MPGRNAHEWTIRPLPVQGILLNIFGAIRSRASLLLPTSPGCNKFGRDVLVTYEIREPKRITCIWSLNQNDRDINLGNYRRKVNDLQQLLT